MMAQYQITKDPEAVLDYGFDWAAWLGDDTITDSEWATSDEDLVQDSDSFTDTTTTIWLSGGVAGQDYQVTNTIVTTAGRMDERSLTVRVRNR
jgi:hypothetical protein